MPKETQMGFAEGMMSGLGRTHDLSKSRVFDWDKAAEIIKDQFAKHPDLRAEAGLQGDWDYTGGTIFDKGQPVSDSYTYLYSSWAEPTLILYWDGEEQLELPCHSSGEGGIVRFHSDSKWDDKSLAILNDETVGN